MNFALDLPEVTNEFAKASVVSVDSLHEKNGEEDLRPDRGGDLVEGGKSSGDILGTGESDSGVSDKVSRVWYDGKGATGCETKLT